ncbi:hypothetical protein [Mobilicoccus massiliensis]|uniref:hypothetical protein n=1 Tax=Mobilicoccus massiliensis TaxID=1522310 RepID=UPI0011434D2C|nr:hypothetical protein [Mobilicoccus massiliensis]
MTTTRARTSRRAAASTMWRPLLAGGLVPCLGLAPVAGVVGWTMGGSPTASSALFGLGLATLFFLVGFACLRLVLAGPASGQMAGALGVFFVQVFLLLGLVDVIEAVPGLDGRAFAVGGLVAALAWQAGQAWAVLRTRRLTYGDLEMPGDAS